MTLTPTAALVGLTMTAAAHTQTAGVIDLNCTVGGSGVVGFDLAMTSKATGLANGESMYGLSLSITGDDNDDAGANLYALNLGCVATGSASKYGLYIGDTDFTCGVYNAATSYFSGTVTCNAALQMGDTKALSTGLLDDDYFTLSAVDNDTDLAVECARLVGAAEPVMDLVRARMGTTAHAADVGHRGMMYRVEGGAGVPDKIYMIGKNSADAYEAILVGTGS
jgi:hypothetical protein